MGKKLIAPPRNELYKMYIEQRKTYREIMQIYGVNSARAIKRWLEMYNIPIRHGGDAVKTQWENNSKRRKEQGNIFSNTSKGNTNRRYSEKQLIEKYKMLGYTYCSREIINGYTYTTLRCKNNHTFTQKLGNYGKKCPICIESNAENEVADILDGMCLQYVRQYRIQECKNERPLPFDFAILDGEKLLFLIEYDGEMHYKDVYGNLGKQIVNDNIKTEYCLKNGIKLLRIPYYADKEKEIHKFIDAN